MYETAGTIIELFSQEILGLILLMIGLTVSIISILIWYLVGRDPKIDPTYAQYDIPDWLSPGLASILYSGWYNFDVATSLFISLARKGFVEISEESSDDYTPSYKIALLKEPSENERNLHPDEEEMLRIYFPVNKDLVIFGKKDSLFLINCQRKLKKYYNNEYKTRFLKKNELLYILFLVSTILAVFLTSQLFYEVGDLLLPVVIASVTSVLLIALVNYIQRLFVGTEGKETNSAVELIKLLFMILLSSIAILYGASVLGAKFLLVPGFILIIIPILVLPFKIRSWTPEGAEAREFIFGLKEYIEVAEKNKLDMSNKILPDSKQMMKVSEYLPYAMALDIEPNWTKRFIRAYYSAMN